MSPPICPPTNPLSHHPPPTHLSIHPPIHPPIHPLTLPSTHPILQRLSKAP